MHAHIHMHKTSERCTLNVNSGGSARASSRRFYIFSENVTADLQLVIRRALLCLLMAFV